jgi:DOPA 4,5-dioxygenase
MAEGEAPWHAHVYYEPEERAAAAALRAALLQASAAGEGPRILFAGPLTDQPVGPHPAPQFEIHFFAPALPAVVAALEASALRALVHPLTDDDLADHSRHARWVGRPLALDLGAVDPPGRNQGMARFGTSDV